MPAVAQKMAWLAPNRWQAIIWSNDYPVHWSIYVSHGLDELTVNSFPPDQNGRRFADDTFSCIFVNEKFCILIKISLKFVPNGPIDNNPELV